MTFREKLAALCAKSLSEAKGGNRHEIVGDMIEALSNSLGQTIAHAADGNPRAIDEICKGAETYILSSASDSARLAVFLATVRGERL